MPEPQEVKLEANRKLAVSVSSFKCFFFYLCAPRVGRDGEKKESILLLISMIETEKLTSLNFPFRSELKTPLTSKMAPHAASSTWSLRKRSLARCRMRSTWMMPPMLSTSTSATRPRTIMVSTSSCRYSGWGTWFRTDSTCTANLISLAVIYTHKKQTQLHTHLLWIHTHTHAGSQRDATSLVVEDGNTYPSMERPWHFCRIFHTFW